MIITQKAMKPARAPNVVVAMSSPDPTIDADRIKPGPRNRRRPMSEVGGSFAVVRVMM